ncbi:hypothetical protein J2O09_00735 [Elizabethkingia anophelis]|uniref:GIY-YIG nuclease family protein n=1 Tax=Elizabethkingia anophelis TaxID=1117645 RepID=UPI0020B8DDBC|nr:hypothetical protein [Elizabethkingia anophelis]UTG61525.1 hypothetical protein J2O09_00735 [Elizabethkingia anophelis]UXM67768.1 hypothetical protein N7E57_00735 [Elizabethkingia anophelis]
MKNPFEDQKYKQGIESFLSMYLDKYQFVLGADLEAYAKSDEMFSKYMPCNIYFILKRPKVTIDPDSFKSKGKEARFDLIVHQPHVKNAISIVTEIQNTESELELFTEYPFNFFAIGNKRKSLLVTRPSSLIDHIPYQNNIKSDVLDYEILYIGQAYGKNGKRTALDRLASHETVQKIYTHALTNNPDSDIWIMLTHFSQVSALFSLGEDLLKDPEMSDKEEEKINDFFKNEGLKFSEKQKINFTEAALIKLFEPPYNSEFKNSFPDKNHKSYTECYSLDIRSLTIELDTSEMVRHIYTKKSGRKKYHSEMFEFENDEDRISLLGIYS